MELLLSCCRVFLAECRESGEVWITDSIESSDGCSSTSILCSFFSRAILEQRSTELWTIEGKSDRGP